MRKLFAVLACALFAACLESPLFRPPDDSASAVSPAEEGNPWDRASAETDTVNLEENTQHRISFTFTADDLTPGSAVSLTIRGEANADVSGGTVVVTLPTKAAMDSAGVGNRPYYSPDTPLPEVARFDLSAMSEGDVWEETVTVPAMAEGGYYLAALSAELQGSEEDTEPFMIDNVHGQAWMLVANENGQLTDFFDETVFPEGAFPQPGPFVTAVPVNTDDSRDGAGTTATHNDVYVNVVYFHGWSKWFQPATNARIWSYLYEYGSSRKKKKIERTVPEDGIVSFPCPGDRYYRAGKGHLPDTDFVEKAPGHFIHHWYATNRDCGDTIMVWGTRSKYMPWRHLDVSAINLISHTGYTRGRIGWSVNWRRKGARYRYRFWGWWDKIEFGRYDYDNHWVAGHEYTHALHNRSMGGLWKTTNCNPHYISRESSYTCAFQEGVADYGGVVGSESEAWETYFENFRTSRGVKGKIEGHVAATFLDLIDLNNENNDQTDLTSRYIFPVFKTCEVNVSSWKKRNDVSDFVWCLEGRVDATLHRRIFPGINPPRYVREKATEPSDWDADEIRSTWLQNLERK
ncbi:MAG: hypothetical protein OXU64_13230 [Gemmatimonadota bacterium]|nr:hypothetical protein [Gemmatimonadota bacterium]